MNAYDRLVHETIVFDASVHEENGEKQSVVQEAERVGLAALFRFPIFPRLD
jgi:hypothetical protein